MRLSEAIRLGATMSPQAFCRLVSEDGGTCALGAAVNALGIQIHENLNWPLAVALRANDCPNFLGVDCPCGCGIAVMSGRFWLIAHLNDDHRWTRERIADFVELHEPLPVPSEMEPSATGMEAVTTPVAQT